METTLQLSPPAYLNLVAPDGKACRIDVYEARRMLDDAGRQPSDESRQSFILKYLAAKLGVDRDTLAESMALEFNDTVVKIIARLNEERQKKTSEIAASLPFTPASPATSAPGP